MVAGAVNSDRYLGALAGRSINPDTAETIERLHGTLGR
jgi:hypothetical protein